MANLLESRGVTLSTSETVKKHTVLVVNDKITLAASATKTYNVATLLGSASSSYDLATIRPVVYVIDNETGSFTNGLYVDGSAVVSVGFNLTGTVKLKNEFSSSLSVLVRAYVTKK